MLSHEYTYAYAALEVQSGELDALILPHVNTGCMQLLLDEVSARHPDEKIVMALDGAGWHRSGSLKPPQNMKLLPLPLMCLNSTRLSMVGMNCARSTFTTKSSIVLMRLRINWSLPCGPSKIIPQGLSPLPHGIGLLLHYRIRNGISYQLTCFIQKLYINTRLHRERIIINAMSASRATPGVDAVFICFYIGQYHARNTLEWGHAGNTHEITSNRA
jgi:hypothetical protein